MVDISDSDTVLNLDAEQRNRVKNKDVPVKEGSYNGACLSGKITNACHLVLRFCLLVSLLAFNDFICLTSSTSP